VTEVYLSDAANSMKVYYNGVEKGSITVQKWLFFAHKKFWVSDPDHAAALGEIANVRITQGRPLNWEIPESTTLLATRRNRHYDTHPVFGPILLQIRHQHTHKVRPEAQKKIHAALDKLVQKLENEQSIEESNVNRLQGLANDASAALKSAEGVVGSCDDELTTAESELTSARSNLGKKRDVFTNDDPVRDEEMEVLDEVLAILDSFENVGNGTQNAGVEAQFDADGNQINPQVAY